MKKVRNLRFLGILCVCIAVLFLMSISFTQSQVSIQKKGGNGGGKPPKDDPPPEATWAVSIPKVEGTMLYGDGSTYENTAGKVIIKVEKNNSRVSVPGGGRRTVFFYYFSFKLLMPTDRYAGFQNVGLTTVGVPEDPSCIFPFPEGCDPTKTCMECFLNQNQPHPDYEYFNLKFQVGQLSFEKANVFCEGLEDMPENVPVKFEGYSDWIKIRMQNQEDFLDPESEFHNVECDERNYDDKDLTNMNIWITRLPENKWRISVKSADLLLQEQYTQRVAGKGKKTTTVTVVPYEATGNFTFYIDFIKITN